MEISWLRFVCALGLLVNVVILAPIDPKHKQEENEGEEDEEAYETPLEYDKYLREVINLLETDEQFKKKLEEADIEDIKSGKIAKELDFVEHGIRTQLDELKRKEMTRLRELVRKKMDADENVMNKFSIEDLTGHINIQAPKSFEMEDLSKLIKKTTSDLDEMDKKRREEFKSYEIDKELDRREKLDKMTKEEQEKAIKANEELIAQRKQHQKELKHPGSKKQLEEVWEETDHMDRDDFDPKLFFKMHDFNNDKQLDIGELESLFVKELQKMSENGDMDEKEIEEEMHRMREHVIKEIDLDGDFMVSYEEFMKAANTQEFENDEGWEEDEVYNEEDLRRIQEQRNKERQMRANMPNNQKVAGQGDLNRGGPPPPGDLNRGGPPPAGQPGAQPVENNVPPQVQQQQQQQIRQQQAQQQALRAQQLQQEKLQQEKLQQQQQPGQEQQEQQQQQQPKDPIGLDQNNPAANVVEMEQKLADGQINVAQMNQKPQ